MQEKYDRKKEEADKRSRLQREKPYVYKKIMQFYEKLQRGESVAIIQFQYNYVCNLRCQHCSVKRFQGLNDKRSLNPDDVKTLSQQADALGLARFVITGGEPLVFKDFDQVVAAIDPEKFYINCDTNGWLLDDARARHLKRLGVDRIQLSLDSLDPEEHDQFRGVKGSHARALQAVHAALNAGLAIFVQTVVTRQRLYSEEFLEFVRFFNRMGIGVFVTYAKPVGAWEGRYDVLVTKQDMDYMRQLERQFNVFTHLTPAYGLNLGCIAVKGMISVTQYGDVLPCPYIHVSIGNILNEPLKNILERGLQIKYFGEHVTTCLIAEDRFFIEKYIAGKVYGRPLPVPYDKVFTLEDRTEIPFHQTPGVFS